MKIRKATKKDIESLVKIWIEFENSQDKYKSAKQIKEFEAMGKNPENWMRKELLRILKLKKSEIFVAELDKKIVGYSSISIGSKSPIEKIKRFGRIHYIYVHSKFRKKGIGLALMKEAKKWFKKQKVKYISLAVMHNNSKAKNLYKKFGFVNKTISMVAKLK